MESARRRDSDRRATCRGLGFLLPILAVLIANIAYGVAPVLVRLYALGNSNAVFFSFLRVTFGIPLLFLASCVSERGRLTRPKHIGEVARLAVVGFSLVTAQVAVIIATYYAQATIISIFQMLQPVIVMVISVLTRTEAAPSLTTLHGWGKLIAIAFAVTGSVLIVTEAPSHDHAQPHASNSSKTCSSDQRLSNTPTERIIGYSLLGVNITTFCLYVVLQKRLLYQSKEYVRWKHYPVSMTAWATLFGYPVQLAALPASRLLMSSRCGQDIGMWTMNGRSVWALEYQIFFNSSVCVFLISWSISQLPPSLVTVFIPSTLVSTVTLAFFVLDERLNVVQYVCMVVIMIGFFLVVWARRREEKMQTEKQRTCERRQGDDDGSYLINEFSLDAAESSERKLVFPAEHSALVSGRVREDDDEEEYSSLDIEVDMEQTML